jgi:hypothetical protein
VFVFRPHEADLIVASPWHIITRANSNLCLGRASNLLFTGQTWLRDAGVVEDS